MSSMSDLPRRDPQQSAEARLDRTLSWSGRIVQPASPCTDLELMARLLAGLRNLAAPAGEPRITGEDPT